MDPLKAYFDAATAEAARPWPAETRESVWREISAARRRARARMALGAFALAAAAIAALTLGRPRQREMPRAPDVATTQPRSAPRDDRATHRADAPGETAAPRDSIEPIDAQSRFDVARSPEGDATTVTLRVGGVRCLVVHRETRRFVVLADEVRVEDRGTSFDVELGAGEVTVSVREGRVDVTSEGRVSTLSAGERGAFPRRRPSAATGRPARSVDSMLAEADARMERGDDAGAITLLRSVTREHREHPRAQAAAMRLGRLLRDQGRPLEAARAFADASSIAPRGPHAEGAAFQEVSALLDGRRRDLATDRAARYATEHPRGLHLEAFRRQGLLP